MKKISLFSGLSLVACLGLFAPLPTRAQQVTFTMQIIADNDFAVLAGTTNSVTEIIYQNNFTWSAQLANLGSLTFSLQPGETTFYVLGMGGGGQENISGTINGVDMTHLPTLMSSDIGPSLTGFNVQRNGGTVAAGTFNVQLADVQSALATATFSSAAPHINTSDAVIASSPNHVGYDFPSETAHLFTFSAASVGVSALQTNWPIVTYPAYQGSVADAIVTAVGTLADITVATNVYYSLNQGPWTAASTTNNWTNWFGTIQPVVGSNSLSVFAVQADGTIVGTNTVPFTWQFEPQITDIPVNNALTNAVWNATGNTPTDSQVSTVYYSVDSSPWQTCSTADNWTNWSANVPLTVAPNTVSFYAVDRLGNVSYTNTVQILRGLGGLYDFSSGDGANPYGRLIYDNGRIFGTTEYGGAYNFGIVYSMNADGSGFTTLYSFSNTSDGANPQAGLALANGVLYGTAISGGSQGGGVVFSLNEDGSGFNVVYNFNANGVYYPVSDLVVSGNTIYGALDYDNVGSGGIYSVNTDGSNFNLLHEFNYSDGGSPYGGLVLAGETLYGTTQSGDQANAGNIFAINTDGSGFTILYTFTAGEDGAYPAANLLLSGNILYGITQQGGTYNAGTIFSLDTNGNNFTTLHSFTVGEGYNSYSALTLTNYTLYGNAEYGGLYNNGGAFSICTNGTGFNHFYDFLGSYDGAQPFGQMLLLGNVLHGAAPSGGLYGSGNIYSIAAPVPTPEIITPSSADVITSSTFVISGYMDTNVTGIAYVAYSTDGTNWTDVDSTDNWSDWSATVQLTAPTTTLYVRAMDTNAVTSTNSITLSLAPLITSDAAFFRNNLTTWHIPVGDLLTNVVDSAGQGFALASLGTSTNNINPVFSHGYVQYYNPNLVDDQFTYTVTNVAGDSATGTVTLYATSADTICGQTIRLRYGQGAVAMTFGGIPGYRYHVQVSTNLVNWTTLGDTNAPAGGLFDFTDTNPPSPSAYYRLMWNGN